MGLPCSPSLFWALKLIWALNKRGLQLNPLQIPQVIDRSTSKQLRTRNLPINYTPIGIFLYMSVIFPVLGPKIARAKKFKGPKLKRSTAI